MGVVPYKQRGWKYSNSIVLFFDLSKRAKDGYSPLYVERSEVQQLCCSVFYFIENIKKQDITKYKPGCPGLLNVT